MKTFEWRKAKRPEEQAVLKNGECFRLFMENEISVAGRGTAKEVSFEVGYRSQAMVSNIIAGIRIPDFKKAVLIAYHLGHDFIDAMILGRSLLDPKERFAVFDPPAQPPAVKNAFRDLRTICDCGNDRLQKLVFGVLSSSSAIAMKPSPNDHRGSHAVKH